MLRKLDLRHVLFLDIETVPLSPGYASLEEAERRLWDKKARNLRDYREEEPEATYQRAGIYAEFARVVCISTGIYSDHQLRVKSFAGHDEGLILRDFAALLQSFYSQEHHLLCAHNGKEFDFPFLARRMVVHGIELPDILDLAGKKPWEVRHLDTMELWKFGDYKSYTSLELLVHILNIPNPKNDIDGSEVGRVYWVDNDLPRIVEYCQRDVVAIVRVMLRFQNKPLVADENIIMM